MSMNVTIFGTGYVGLVTGACFADHGMQVLCMDIDSDKIARLRAGQLPIYEPGLESLVVDNAAAGRLRFTDNPAEAVAHGEYIFIAVGTPPGEDGGADLQHVLTVAATIGCHMDEAKIVIDKSTVPVGTAEKVAQCIGAALAERGESLAYTVVANPEFLKEGAAIDDCMKPDRIVIGTDDADALQRMRALYAPFCRNREKIIAMDVRSAELTKYAANAMLATKISFMNEMANVAERVGANIEAVRRGIGSDPRIGFSFIYPGCGYGGSCFPKDVKALVSTAREHGYRTRILDAVEAVNKDQKAVLLERVQTHFGSDLSGRRFALWGLSFKPDTDDVREAPSCTIMEGIWARGGHIQAYDPEARDEIARLYGARADLRLCSSAMSALEGADALILVTEWKEFRGADFSAISRALTQPVIFDGRNIYDPVALERMGFVYYGIGRGRSVTEAKA